MDYARLQKDLSAHSAGRLLLRMLTLPYWLATGIRRALYAARLLPSRRIPMRVICLGNLTTGGTGKTSAVLRAALDMTDKGLRVGILTRGYGRPRESGTAVPVAVLSDTHKLSWSECGDEPWMMHQVLEGRGVPIFIAPSRARAAETAAMFGLDALLMDDGFQHFALRRDTDIVCLNALDPFGGDALLPLGRLREPPSALRRASAVLLTHADKASRAELEALRERLEEIRPGLGVIESRHAPDFFLNLKTHQRLALDALRGRPAVSLCGIATPELFETALKGLGVAVAQCWRYPDHHPYSADEMRALEELKQGAPVVTTMKDFPRLPEGWQGILSGDLYALVIRLEILKGRRFWEELLCG